MTHLTHRNFCLFKILRKQRTHHALVRVRVERCVVGRLGVPEAVQVISHDVEQVQLLGQARNVVGLVHHLLVAGQGRSHYVLTTKGLQTTWSTNF